MSGVGSALTVKIETGEATKQLLALKGSLRSTADGISRLGLAVTRHGEDIQKALSNLSKHGFGGLSQSLNTETRKVGSGMLQLEREVEAAAAKTGKIAGRRMAKGLTDGAEEGSRATHRIMLRSAEMTGRLQLSNAAKVLSQEASMWKAYEADKLHSQKLYHKVAVLETRETSAQVKAIKAEEASMWKAYEADKVAAVRLRVKQVQALELSMGRQTLSTAIARNTGLGMSPAGSTMQYREGTSAFGAVEAGAVASAMRKGTPAVNESKEAMKAWSGEAKYAHDMARGAAAGVGYLWMTWGNIGAMAAGFAAVRGGTAALKEMAEVEVLLTKASKEAGVGFQGMKDQMMAMYTDGVMPMMTGPKEVAQQLKDLVYAGFSASEAFDMLGVSLKFAEVGELDAAEAAQVLQQTIHAFGLTGKDAGRVADVMAKAAASSATDVGKMASAMRQAVTVGALYNASVEDTSIALAVLAKAGLEGTVAGTALKRFMDEMASPKTTKAKAAIEGLGLKVYETVGKVTKLKTLSTIIDEVRDKLKGLSAVDQKAFYETIDKLTDERGKKFMSLAIKMDEDSLRKIETDVKESSRGFVDTMYKALSETTQGLFKQTGVQLRASMQEGLKGADEAIKDLGASLLTLVTSSGFKEFLSASVSLLSFLTKLLVDHGRELLIILAFYKGTSVVKGMFDLMGGGWSRQATYIGNIGELLGPRGLGQSLKGVHTAVWNTGGGFKALSGLIGRLFGVAGIAYTVFVTFKSLTESILGPETIQRWGDHLGKAFARMMNWIDQLRVKWNEVSGDQAEAEALRAGIQNRTNAHLQSSKAEELLKLQKELAQANTAVAQLSKVDPSAPKGSPRNMSGRSSAQLGAETVLANEKVSSLQAKITSLAAVVAAKKTPAMPPKESNTKAWDVVNPPGEEPKTSKAKKSTSPLSVVNYDAEIKMYSAYLSEIDKVEQDALRRSTAIRDASLTSESAYLAERTAIRAKADAEAKTQLDAYVQAQKAAAATARAEQQKQINEGKSKGLISEAKGGKLSGDEATLNKVTAAANRAVEAIAKADQASAEYAARSVQRADAAALDALARMKDKYGNPDEAIAKAQEAVAAINVENDAIMNLSETTRDKTTVSIESSIRSVEGLITEAWATAEVTGMTIEHVNELERKLGALRALDEEYKKQKGLQDLTKGDPMLGAKQGVRDYLKSAETMGETTRKIVSKSFKGMEDALTSFVMNGKLDFKSLANSIIEDLIRIAARQAISSAVTGIAGMFGFADGGIMSSSGSVPLRAYSSGGIADSPQFAIYGEGRKPEAYVPLPDGRTIPVTLKGGGGGGGGDVNTTISIQVMTDGNTTVTRDGASKMGQQIEAEVMRVIFREKRQGGVLSGAA